MQQFRTKNLFTSRNLIRLLLIPQKLSRGEEDGLVFVVVRLLLVRLPLWVVIDSSRSLSSLCHVFVVWVWRVIPHPVLCFSLSEKGSKTSSFRVLVLDLVKIHSFDSGWPFFQLTIVGEIWVQLVEFQTFVLDSGQASCPAYNLLVKLFLACYCAAFSRISSRNTLISLML